MRFDEPLRWAMLLGWLAAIHSPTAARADDAQRFRAGLRAGITVTDGEPANDIPGYGLFGHYRLDDRWTIGVSVDQTEFDYEEPAKILGIPVESSGEPIDAVAEANVLGVWIERNFSASQSRTDWFLGAGIAAASVDVPDVTGPRGDTGSFDIHTEVDTEIIVSLMGGVRRELGENWFIEFVLRADQHFADWTSTDRISGATATIDDYTAFGGQLGLGFRF